MPFKSCTFLSVFFLFIILRLFNFFHRWVVDRSVILFQTSHFGDSNVFFLFSIVLGCEFITQFQLYFISKLNMRYIVRILTQWQTHKHFNTFPLSFMTNWPFRFRHIWFLSIPYIHASDCCFCGHTLLICFVYSSICLSLLFRRWIFRYKK